MAFTWIFHENFELGTKGDFDTKTDTDGILDYPSYKTLAAQPWSKCTPFTGAYCLRIKPAGGTNDATLTEADINIADTVTNYFHFNVMFCSDFDATADDTFALLELKGAAAAVTVSIGARYVALTDVINFGCGGAAANAVPDNWSTMAIQKNVWYTLEAKVNIETNGTGTIDLYVTPEGEAAQTTATASDSSLTNIAVTDGVFGLQDQEATTTGTILLDNFIHDDARIYPITDRWSRDVLITKSQHIFVGRGKVNGLQLLSGGATNVCTLYDTDSADATDHTNLRAELKAGTNNLVLNAEPMPVDMLRGAFVELSGTGPRALVSIGKTQAYGSDAVLRNYGMKA